MQDEPRHPGTGAPPAEAGEEAPRSRFRVRSDTPAPGEGAASGTAANTTPAGNQSAPQQQPAQPAGARISLRRQSAAGTGDGAAGQRIAIRRTLQQAQQRIVLRRTTREAGGGADLRLRRRGWKQRLLEWRRWWLKPPALAAYALVIVLAAGIPGWLWYQQWRLEQRHQYAQQFVGLGHKAMIENNARQALIEYGRAIELWPELAPAWVGHGNAYIALVDRTKAFADYAQAIKLAPERPEAWRARAIVYEAIGEAAAAERDYRKLIELRPDEPYYLDRLARVLYDQDKKAEVERVARRVFEQDKKRDWAMETWLGAVLERGPEALLAQVRELEQQGVRGGSIAYYRGIALLKLKRYSEAIAPLKEALQGDPAKIPTGVAVSLATAQRDSGDRDACRATMADYWKRMGRTEEDLRHCDQQGEQ